MFTMITIREHNKAVGKTRRELTELHASLPIKKNNNNK